MANSITGTNPILNFPLLGGNEDPIDPNNYVPAFTHKINLFVEDTLKSEQKERFKAKVMKVVFVSLVVLAALSIITTGIIGGLTAFSVIAIAGTTLDLVISGLIVGSGLLTSIAAMLNFPKNYVKSFISEALKLNEKADYLKKKMQTEDLGLFINQELIQTGLKNIEKLASSSEFVELFYITNQIDDKSLELRTFEQDITAYRTVLLRPLEGLSVEELEEQNEIKEKLKAAEKLLGKMLTELNELKNRAANIRKDLADLDKQ